MSKKLDAWLNAMDEEKQVEKNQSQGRSESFNGQERERLYIWHPEMKEPGIYTFHFLSSKEEIQGGDSDEFVRKPFRKLFYHWHEDFKKWDANQNRYKKNKFLCISRKENCPICLKGDRDRENLQDAAREKGEMSEDAIGDIKSGYAAQSKFLYYAVNEAGEIGVHELSWALHEEIRKAVHAYAKLHGVVAFDVDDGRKITIRRNGRDEGRAWEVSVNDELGRLTDEQKRKLLLAPSLYDLYSSRQFTNEQLEKVVNLQEYGDAPRKQGQGQSYNQSQSRPATRPGGEVSRPGGSVAPAASKPASESKPEAKKPSAPAVDPKAEEKKARDADLEKHYEAEDESELSMEEIRRLTMK